MFSSRVLCMKASNDHGRLVVKALNTSKNHAPYFFRHAKFYAVNNTVHNIKQWVNARRVFSLVTSANQNPASQHGPNRKCAQYA